MSNEIIEVEAKVKWFGAWCKKAVLDIWNFIIAFTQFLDDPNGKFSHKRIISLAAAILAIRQLLIGDRWGALGCALTSVILAVVSAITKT